MLVHPLLLSVHQTDVSTFLPSLAVLAQAARYVVDFNLSPLPSGYVYLGPDAAYATACRCSTVYYSMLSACSSCQGHNFVT